MPKIVFITGATSGFGKACAEKFASHGYDLILNGRREERLEEIKARLEKKFNIYMIPLKICTFCYQQIYNSVILHKILQTVI